MKLNSKELEILLLKSFDELDKTKESCKVSISQCLYNHNHTSVNSLIRSCMETMDLIDLCKLFIINKSPNTKASIGLAIIVLKGHKKECKKLFNDEMCKEVVSYCYDMTNKTIKTLEELYEGI
jgi:hypothetical protein